MILINFLDMYLRMKAKAEWQNKPSRIGKIQLGYVENYGAFRGIFRDNPKEVLKLQNIFVVFSLLYTLFIVLSGKRSITQISWMLISLGGMSNLWDRAVYGFVTDYFSFNGKLYFNIADMLVFAGTILLVLQEAYGLATKTRKKQKEEYNVRIN